MVDNSMAPAAPMSVPVGARGPYPGGKRFAFTILDDTDDSTVENARPVYDLLHELGIRTTKTVWPVDCPEGSRNFFAAETMQDPAYRDWCLELAERGFEVTWHGATMESSRRGRTIEALEAFHGWFGRYPSLHANHGQNAENLYWGEKRYRNPFLRLLARFRTSTPPASGEVEGSEYYWGDLCREHIRYVRNFAFREVNTLAVDPDLPYRLASTPCVRYWFSRAAARAVADVSRLIARSGVDRLVEEGGVCILSTHLGKGFWRDGRVDPHFEETLRYMASLPGWFAPVSEILDWRVAQGAGRELGRAARLKLELRHARDRVRG